MANRSSTIAKTRLYATQLPKETPQLPLEAPHSGRESSPSSMRAPESIEDRSQIVATLRAAAGYGKHCVLRRHGLPSSPIVPLAVDDEGNGSITWRPLASIPQPPFVIDVESHNAVHHVPVIAARTTEAGLVTDLPRRVVRTRARAFRRGRVPPGWDLSFARPSDEAIVARPLLDVSWEGVAFRFAPTDRFCLGAHVPAWILIDGAPAVELRVEVRALRPWANGYRCGARVEPATPGGARAWAALVDRVLHPLTHAAENPDALWDLYASSGYFELSGKSPAEFEEVRPGFAEAIQRLATARDMGIYAVWSNDDRAEAVVSSLRIYSGTYFASQMAKRPGKVVGSASRREVLREIQLHAYERAWRDPSCRWILTYVHEGARLNHLMCATFAERYDGTSRGCVSLARGYEVSCAETTTTSESDVEVCDATPAELDAIVDALAAACPSPYVEALDLVRDRIDLAGIGACAAAAGIVRDRRVVVARHRGRAVCAAVLDCASDGLHLFGLLDTARLFPLHGEITLPIAALLGTARRFYRDRGKHRFMVMRDGPWSPDLALEAGATELGSAILTIFAADVMPDWFEHIHEQLAPRSE